MSFTKLDPLFPGYKAEISNKNLVEIIVYSLHQDFGQETSSIKAIGEITGANLRTIKNWYDGLKVPSSLHFIQLLHASPTLKKFILTHLFGDGFWEDYDLIYKGTQSTRHCDDSDQTDTEKIQNDDPINDPINLNERQKWFLLKLKNDRNKGAEDIVRQFEVSLSSAKRDIAALRGKGLIAFNGANKTGYYVII